MIYPTTKYVTHGDTSETSRMNDLIYMAVKKQEAAIFAIKAAKAAAQCVLDDDDGEWDDYRHDEWDAFIDDVKTY
jgi:hypothetical protein